MRSSAKRTPLTLVRAKRELDPLPHLPSTMPLEGRRALGTAGPCCGGRWVAGYPCASVLGGEDGRAAAARRRRLKS